MLACVVVLCSAVTLGAAGAPVIDAVKSGNVDAVRALLQKRADVNAAEADGMTALHWAARNNDLESARLLLRAGANAKATTRYGFTPLALAAQNGSAPMLDLLLKAGADANAAMPEGETALMTAARTGSAAAIKVLAAHGANVNARESWMGESAIAWAAAENHTDAVKSAHRARRRRQREVEGADIPRVQVDDLRHGQHRAPARRLDAAHARGAAGSG